MKQLIVAALASLGVLGLGTMNPALAQAFRPFTPGYGGNPALSPYLNLLQRGNAAVNYYGLVRPQQQYNSSIYSLEQQVQASRVATTAAENANVPATGHPIYFLNYQRYFLNTGAVAPFQNVQATVGSGAGTTTSSAGQRATSSFISGASNVPYRRY